MADEPMPALSPAETEILRLVWQLGRGTVQEVLDSLPSHRPSTYGTVQTLLRRLEKKGYVAHEARGKAHVFRPAVRREAVVQRSVGDFVDRLFGGDPVPLLLHLADRADLSADDVRRLRRILKQNDA